MIIVRLRGGLGNQLFQYAAGKALADHYSVPLKLDTYTYSKHKYRKFELDNFKIDCQIASRKEVHQFTGSNFIARYLHKRNNFINNQKIFAQPYFHYYPGFFQLPSDIYLSGYWQSERYFASIKPMLGQLITPKRQISHQNQKKIEEIKQYNAVSVHIRHGDYVTNPKYNQFFGTLDRDYYLKAISHIRQNTLSPRFYLFSDDQDWVSKEFGDLEDCHAVDINRGDDSYLDLILMSYCKHHIIANSTFSWWGAWLNFNPDKIVIAPQKRFKLSHYQGPEPVYLSRDYDEKDYLPVNWIKL